MHWRDRAIGAAIALLLLLVALTAHAETLLITDVNIVDVDRGSIREGRDVHIVDGRIASIQPHQEGLSAEAQTIVGESKYLVPGFWDMHVHFRTRKFVDEPHEDALVRENEMLLPLYLQYGITGVFDMGTDIPAHLHRWRSEINEGQRIGPRLLLTGQKVEGPGAEFAGSLEVRSRKDVDRILSDAKSAGLDGVKVMALWIDPQVQQYLFDESRRLGLKTFVHALETFRATDLSNDGISAIAHMNNLLPEASSDFDVLAAEVNARKAPTEAPGNWYWGLVPQFSRNLDPGVFGISVDTLLGNDTAVISTFNGNRLDVRKDRIESEILASLHEVGPRFAENVRAKYERRLNRDVADSDRDALAGNVDLLRAIVSSDLLFLIGTDSGFGNHAPGESFHFELAALQEAGAPAEYLLRAATLNPAVFMGTQDHEGTVDEGKAANLVLLNANPLEDIRNAREISAVIRDGRLVEISPR